MSVWKQVRFNNRTNEQDRAILSYKIRDRLIYLRNIK